MDWEHPVLFLGHCWRLNYCLENLLLTEHHIEVLREQGLFKRNLICTSSSIGTATLVGFGLLNNRWVFSAGRFLQSAFASGASNPQPGGPAIWTFQLPPPGVPHVWNDASEPQQRKVELWAKNFREICRKWWLPRQFWVLLHAVNLWQGTYGFTSFPKEGVLRIFSPQKSDGFGRIWTPRTRVPEASTLTYCVLITRNVFIR